jgi:hypothetical protein
MVRFPDRNEWEYRFQPNRKRAYYDIQTFPKHVKELGLRCMVMAPGRS